MKRNRIGPPGANWWDKKRPVKDKPKPPWQLSAGRRPLPSRTETYTFNGTVEDFNRSLNECTLELINTSDVDIGDSVAADDGSVFRVIKKTAKSVTLAPTGNSIGRWAAAML